MRAWSKRFAWPVLVVFGLPAVLALAWAAAWLVFSPVVERRLEALLERRFAGDVELGALHYLAPYWVIASDAVLRSEVAGEPVDWIRVRSLRARLDRIPGTGPVAIEKLTLAGATVTLLHEGGKLREASDLWRRAKKRRPGKLPLRRIAVHDLTVEYRAAGEGGVDGPQPRTFGGFDLLLDVDREGARAYDARAWGGGERLELDGAGRLDLEERTLRVATLDATATPPGEAGGEGSARVALRDAQGTIELGAGRWRLDGARLEVGPEPPLVLGDLRVAARSAPGTLELQDLHATVLGGTLEGSARVRGDGASRWRATLEARGVDLALVARRFGGGDVRGRLSGAVELAGPLATERDALLAGLRGDGSLRVTGGRLYELPVVGALLDAVAIGADAATVSDASAQVSVADRVVRLDDLALGSPAVGMDGEGEIGFDRRVDLDVVVVPLGDWKQKLEATGVPVLDGAIATIAGAVQSLFSEASAVVYAFRVSGTLADPSVVPVPAPALTRSAAELFARMVSGRWQEDLVSGRAPRAPDGADSPRASRE